MKKTVRTLASGEHGYIKCTDLWVDSFNIAHANLIAIVHDYDFAKSKVEMIKISNIDGKLYLDLENYKFSYKWSRQVITNVYSMPTSKVIYSPKNMPAEFLEPDLLFSQAAYSEYLSQSLGSDGNTVYDLTTESCSSESEPYYYSDWGCDREENITSENDDENSPRCITPR